MKKKQLPPMPTFTQKIRVPAGFHAHALYIRYYSPWGDGTRGPLFSNEVYWPDVFLPDNAGELHAIEASPPSLYGFSLYCTPEVFNISGSDDEREIIVSGHFEQAAYCSLTLYNEGDNGFILSQENIQGRDFVMDSGGLNPFISGNPSVFAYERPFVKVTANKNVKSIANSMNNSLLITEKAVSASRKTENKDDQYYFYRPTAQMAHSAVYGKYESIADDGCSPDYLYSMVKNPEHDFFILKLKVPSTFIHSDSVDVLYSDYQVQEVVIGNAAESYVINSRQLNDYKDDDGYAYVFLAPPEFIQQLEDEQNTPTFIPPVYTWGEYTGYVLPASTTPGVLLIIRHRGSSSDWAGGLTNTQCYIKNENLEPVVPSDLGEWYPELYGDTMENFKAGKIGPFCNKKQARS